MAIWNSSTSGVLYVHAKPKIYITGVINFDAGTYTNLKASSETGFYGYDSYLSIYKGKPGTNGSVRTELKYFPQYTFGTRENRSPVTVPIGSSTFNHSSGAEYYILFECQQSEALVGEDCDTWNANTRLDKGLDGNFISTIKTYPNNSSAYFCGSIFKMTTFDINPGTLTILDGYKREKVNGANRFTGKVKYERKSAIKYYGAQSSGSSTATYENKIRIKVLYFKQDTDSSLTTAHTVYISNVNVSNNSSGTYSFDFNIGNDKLPTKSWCEFWVYVTEKFGDSSYTTLSDNFDCSGFTTKKGSIALTASRSGKTTIIAKPKYTPGESGVTFWGAISANTAKNSTNSSKVWLAIYANSNLTTPIQQVYVSKDATSYSFTNNIAATTAYTIKAAVVEDIDGTPTLSSAVATIAAESFNAGTLTITTATKVGDGSKVQANAKYTKGSPNGATAVWGSTSTSGTTDSNKNKILLRIMDFSGTKVGDDKYISASGGSNVEWAGLISTEPYTIYAYAIEQLENKNSLLASADVEAYAAPGYVQIEGERTENTLVLTGTYFGEAKFWAAKNIATAQASDLLNKVYVSAVEKGTNYSYENTPIVAKVSNGGSYTFTVNRYKTYKIYATCNENIGGANKKLLIAQAEIEADKKPIDPTDLVDMYGWITGTTISMQPVFEFGDIKEVNWSAKLGRITVFGKSTPSESTKVRFELLANSTTYNIIFHGLHAATVNKDPNMTDAEGNAIEVDTDIRKLEYAATDISYDCMTYGCSISAFKIGKNYFDGRLSQVKGAMAESYHLMVEGDEKSYSVYCRTRNGSSIGNTNVGNVTISGTDVYISGLEPSTNYRVFVYLNDCKDKEPNGDPDANNYLDFTTEAKAVAGAFNARVTGKTVTVVPYFIRWNNSDYVNWTVTAHKGAPDGPVAGTGSVTKQANASTMPSAWIGGLENGTKYYLTFTATDDGNNDIPIENIEIITYGVTLQVGTTYTRMVKDNIIKYTEGERASATAQDASRGSAVKYIIATMDGDVIIDSTTVNCRRTNPNIFDTYPIYALTPNTDYRFIAYIDGISAYSTDPAESNGEEVEIINDTIVSDTFKTKYVASNLQVVTDATGTTISVTPTWIASNSPNNTLTCQMGIFADGVLLQTKETTVSGTAIWFTGLQRGKEHTIGYYGQDNEGNTVENFITYADGYNGSTTETTYKLFFENVSKSTRSVQFDCHSNRGLPAGRVIQYEIIEDLAIRMDWTGSMNDFATSKYILFRHNTPFSVRVRIEDMRDQDGNFDTVEEYTDKTNLFELAFSDYIPHIHILETKWQALADQLEYNIDPISGIPITFVPDKITISPNRPGHGYTGSNYGTYYPKMVRYFNGLSGAREYHIEMCVTDGINEATASVDLWTLLQLVRIYSKTHETFLNAIPYIYTDKVDGEPNWYIAPAYVYSRGKFRDTNPERDERHFYPEDFA